MRIRFRPSVFGLVAKRIISFPEKSKQTYCAEIVLGSLILFAIEIQHLCSRTQKIQAKVDYCYVQGHVVCTWLGPGLERLSLRSDSSLAKKRCTDALHDVFSCDYASEPGTRASCWCSVCTFAMYVATKDAPRVGFSPCSLGPSPRRPTASCSLAEVRRGDCVRSSWCFHFSLTHPSQFLLVLLRVPRTAAVPGWLSAAFDVYY